MNPFSYFESMSDWDQQKGLTKLKSWVSFWIEDNTTLSRNEATALAEDFEKTGMIKLDEEFYSTALLRWLKIQIPDASNWRHL